MSEITGHEYPLLKIFSSDFEYHIPAYQRPYAWTVEETSTLFDDLYSFYTSEPEDENYFLGSIVLIKENTDRRADVIDGQQRLTTLTILFAVLAECLKEQRRLAGLTQEQLAEKIGTKKSYISKIENGVITPSVGVFYRIIAALGMRVEVVKPIY